MAKKGRCARKSPPCGRVDIPAVWKRIETSIQHLEPELAANLAPGASKKEITAFEKAIGQTLPEEVRQHFLCHNGQRGQRRIDPEWRRSWIFTGLHLLSLEDALKIWQDWRGMDDDEDLQEGVGEVGSSTPKDAIRLGYSDPNWVPLVDIYQKMDLIGIDLKAGPKGLPGQVINFGRNEDDKRVLAWSWGWFLHDLAEELEDGNFQLEPDEDGGLLEHKRWPSGCLCNATDNWSKTKLGHHRPLGQNAAVSLKSCRSDSTVEKIARSIDAELAFEHLPILGDALEEAGCTDAEILRHCREPGEHACGCWVCDLLLAKR